MCEYGCLCASTCVNVKICVSMCVKGSFDLFNTPVSSGEGGNDAG